MLWFQQSKIALVGFLNLSKDALHIHLALLVFFGAMLIFRWRANQWKPWLLVLGVVVVGEACDIYGTYMGMDVVFWAESRKDILNSMAWPTLILLLARATRSFGKRR